MKTHHLLILLVLLSFGLSSCGTTARTNGHYASSDAGVLEIAEKDDLKVAGSLSMSGLGDGINVQAGYSPIKHVVIASSYIGMFHKRSDTNKGLTSNKFNLIEGSIGTYYFLPFKKQSKDIGLLADIYGGYGLGKVKNEYGGEANSSLNFNHYYLQGGLHLRMKWLGISYLIKQTSLDYTKGNINYVTWNSGYFRELNDLKSAPISLNGHYLRMNFYIKSFKLYITYSKLQRKDFQDGFIFTSSGFFQRSTFPLEMINIGVTTDIHDLIDFIKNNGKNKISGHKY